MEGEVEEDSRLPLFIVPAHMRLRCSVKEGHPSPPTPPPCGSTNEKSAISPVSVQLLCGVVPTGSEHISVSMRQILAAEQLTCKRRRCGSAAQSDGGACNSRDSPRGNDPPTTPNPPVRRCDLASKGPTAACKLHHLGGPKLPLLFSAH